LLTWVITLSISSPFGAVGFIAILLCVATALTFRWLKQDSPKSAEEESTDREAMPLAETSSTLFYLPGCGITEHTPHAHDGRAITILYDVPSSKRDDFREAMAMIAKVRRCQGALHWRLSQDLEKPARFTESYLLESYQDYQQVLRHERAEDLAAKQHVFELNDWDSLPYESHEEITEV
jgi:quinol monooxygenase YgiN